MGNTLNKIDYLEVPRPLDIELFDIKLYLLYDVMCIYVDHIKEKRAKYVISRLDQDKEELFLYFEQFLRYKKELTIYINNINLTHNIYMDIITF